MGDQNLRSLFSGAERIRKELESSYDANSTAYQQNLAAAIASYEDCLKLADRTSLFSPNETLEDIASGDLQYVLLILVYALTHTRKDTSSSTTDLQV